LEYYWDINANAAQKIAVKSESNADHWQEFAGQFWKFLCLKRKY
jgi:hypothetical protein